MPLRFPFWKAQITTYGNIFFHKFDAEPPPARNILQFRPL